MIFAVQLGLKVFTFFIKNVAFAEVEHLIVTLHTTEMNVFSILSRRNW
ncbi:MAG: hypothetical protein ACTS4T_01590 [Candidatus Hodgkinia cicadicola]